MITVLSFLVSVGIFLFTFLAEELQRRNQYLADLAFNEDPNAEGPDHRKFWL